MSRGDTSEDRKAENGRSQVENFLGGSLGGIQVDIRAHTTAHHSRLHRVMHTRTVCREVSTEAYFLKELAGCILGCPSGSTE